MTLSESETTNQCPAESFGIGCFHFGIEPRDSAPTDAEAYAAAIVELLESIPSIASIEVDLYDRPMAWDRPSECLSVGNLGSFFPPIQIGRIEFLLHIPMRVQHSLPWGSLVGSGSEDFLVRIEYNFFGPVTFVVPRGASSTTKASTSVIAVREFLGAEIDKLPDTPLRLEVLGPSPFHMDCLVSPQQGAETGALSFRRVEHPAYDTLEVSYDPAKYSSVEAARDDAFEAMGSELGFFYSLVARRNAIRHAWYELDDSVDAATQLYEESGHRGTLRRWFGSSKPAWSANLMLSRFERRRLWEQNYAIDHYDSAIAFGPNVARRDIESEIERLNRPYPLDQVTRLLDMVSTSRQRRNEGVYLLVAAVVGGAIGATITAVL